MIYINNEPVIHLDDSSISKDIEDSSSVTDEESVETPLC